MIRLLGVFVVLGALVAISWFAFPVWRIDVSGTRVLSAHQVSKLAGVVPGGPWLWTSARQAETLKQSPWILKATLKKQFPGRVSIMIEERVPIAVWRRGRDRLVVSKDGVVLPGAPLPKLVLEGWGGNRLNEALEVAQLLESLRPKAVYWTPKGFRVQTATIEVWTDSLASLRKQGVNVTMARLPLLSHPSSSTTSSSRALGVEAVSGVVGERASLPARSRRVNVYSWGVSAQP